MLGRTRQQKGMKTSTATEHVDPKAHFWDADDSRFFKVLRNYNLQPTRFTDEQVLLDIGNLDD